MIYRHTPEQVQDYYDRFGMNQSSLKIIISDGIESFIVQRDELQRQDDLYYEEKRHFTIGSAVDCNITHGEEVFKDKYFISELKKKPGPKALSVIKHAFDLAKENFPNGPTITLTDYRKEIFDAANYNEYLMNRVNKDNNHELDTRIGDLLKQNGQAYWADLWMAQGKQVLSEDEQMIISSIIISLRTHKHTAHLFKDADDIDIVFQFPMYFTCKDVDCKGMIDIIIINHTKKRIMPIDLKTFSGYTLTFPKSIKRRRYDLQGAFYTEGLRQSLTQLATLIDKHLMGYTIANFAFIAESSTKPGCPMIYVLENNMLEMGRIGDEKEEVLGWEQALEIYKIWLEAGFSLEKRFEATNGVLFVNKENLNSAII